MNFSSQRRGTIVKRVSKTRKQSHARLNVSGYNNVLQPEERKGPPTRGALDLFKNMRVYTPLFPITTRKKLVYSEPFISLVTSAGIYGQYVFSANGLFDPDFTSTGHQPIGWDQLMQYYNQATCLASKISVRCTNNGGNAAFFGVCLAPDTTTLTSANFLENGLNTSIATDGRGTVGTGERIHTLNLACDVSKYFGRRGREILNDSRMYSTAAANPTEQVYYILGTYEYGALTDNISMQLEVIIEYDVVFWEPKKAPPSLEGRTATYLALKNERLRSSKLQDGLCNGEGKRA